MGSRKRGTAHRERQGASRKEGTLKRQWETANKRRPLHSFPEDSLCRGSPGVSPELQLPKTGCTLVWPGDLHSESESLRWDPGMDSFYFLF